MPRTPPDFKTRCISESAFLGSLRCSSIAWEKTASNVPSGKHAEVFDDPGHQEELDHDTHHVHDAEELRVELSNVLFDAEPTGGAGGDGLPGGVFDHAAEDVLAGGVDPVEAHEHDADHEQVGGSIYHTIHQYLFLH